MCEEEMTMRTNNLLIQKVELLVVRIINCPIKHKS